MIMKLVRQEKIIEDALLEEQRRIAAEEERKRKRGRSKEKS